MRATAWLLVVALLLTACAPVTAEVEGGHGAPTRADHAEARTLVAAVGGRLVHLDPHKTTAYPPHPALENLYDTLVVPDAQTLEMRPALATAWDVSDDKLTWTFTLRPGVTFHDGSALDAADVVYSLERIIDEQLVSAARLEPVARVAAVDDTTVRLTVRRPTPDLPARLGASTDVAILPEGAADQLELASQANGTGPFTLESDHRGTVRLRAFGDYWGAASTIDGVEIRHVDDPEQAVADVRSGAVHWTDHIPASQIDPLDAAADTVVGRQPSVDYWYLAVNFERAPFDDVRVRRALAHAIDRQAFAAAVSLRKVTPNQTAIPASSVWAIDHEPYAYDPAVARRLLREAGAEELSIDVMVSDELPRTVRAADIVVRQLRAVGVDAQRQVVPFDTFLRRRDDGLFDALLSGWLGAIDPHAAYHDQHLCNGALNFQHYCDEDVDALLRQAATEVDRDRRWRLYDWAVRRIVDDVSYLHLYNTDVVQAWVPGLTGLALRPDRAVNFETVAPPR